MKNCEIFIHHILSTSRDELLLKFWRQKLEQENAAKRDQPPVVIEIKEEEAVLLD